MHNPLLCSACRRAAEFQDDALIGDEIIVSKRVIFVHGTDYCSFESAVRPVFSEMLSGFEKHLGACFARYQSGGSHNHDFTLVVTGKDNPHADRLLEMLLPRCAQMIVCAQLQTGSGFAPVLVGRPAPELVMATRRMERQQKLLTDGTVNSHCTVDTVSSPECESSLRDSFKVALASLGKY